MRSGKECRSLYMQRACKLIWLKETVVTGIAQLFLRRLNEISWMSKNEQFQRSSMKSSDSRTNSQYGCCTNSHCEYFQLTHDMHYFLKVVQKIHPTTLLALPANCVFTGLQTWKKASRRKVCPKHVSFSLFILFHFVLDFSGEIFSREQ